MDFDFFLQVILESLTLFFLLLGLAGLIIPIFPGLTIMWLAALIYAIFQNIAEKMTTWDWVLFGLITALMLIGNILDNIIIARKMRDHYIPWRSILLAFAAGILASLFFTPLMGLIASPAALFTAEYLRLRNRGEALNSTKAWMIGWGWAFAARFSIGVVIISFWMLWAWV
ncbi:MAG: hypothetical protein A2Y54_00455 [Chloroflexi bacterium RBG_16_51_16]|nr:MAG: hypothetical protein A2Y54_00455 [Chloroflexi bacterium RBG_16_51_16]